MLKVIHLSVDGSRIREGARFCLIDSVHPTFAWAVVSSRENNAQSACRVTVEGKDFCWDSGWLEQAEQSLCYRGEDLPGGVPLCVSVTLRDLLGEESEPCRMSIVSGLLQPHEFTGQWIGSREETGGRVLYFRRSFHLHERPERVCMYVCGLGYQAVTLNGMEITDARLDPAHSDYAKTVYYTVHPDLLSFLQIGENVIGVEVAEGWRNNYTQMGRDVLGSRRLSFAGPSQLWAMLVLVYRDGHTETVATDESWRVKFGPITRSSIFHGETYEADRADKGWNCPGASSAEFTTAISMPAPGGEMRPMVLEPIRSVGEYPAIEVTAPKPGAFVVDFGCNLAGVVRIVLPENMRAGQTVTLRFAEELNEDGTLYTAPLREAQCTDCYVASGDSRDLLLWEPRFTYHGFRYCEITGLDYLAKEDVTAVLLCTDLKNRSFFRCGSALVNQIQENLVRTEMDNMHSILSDCPQRDERMAWMNDATVRFEETPYNFHIGRMFPKIVRDIRDEQREDGAFPCCCPFYYGTMPGDPVCSSYLMAAYQAWMHTGNSEVLRESFDGLAAWEDFLISQSRDGIVGYSYYGDWAAPAYACVGEDGAVNAETEGILMSTGYSYLNCRLLAKMARAIGRDDRADYYDTLGETVREAFLKKWFDPDTAMVGSGSQGAHAFALWLEILPEDARQAAADRMARDLAARDYHFTTGNLCTRYLFDMLAKYGHVDIAWKLLNRETYPSYGYMIQNEATTVWERFELKKNPLMNSHNHPMYGAVGYFFYAWIAGVTPLTPGWECVRIAPVLPEGLCSAQAVVDTVRGDVCVRWSTRYGKNRLFIQIPFGMTAEVSFCGITQTFGSGYHRLEV